MGKIGSLLLGAAVGVVGIGIATRVYRYVLDDDENTSDNPFDDGDLDNYEPKKGLEATLDEVKAKSGENPFVGL